jgi:enoyl-CoA hydratase/carnithine racemase
MAHFFERFNHLCMDLLTLPIPTICALAGHAVAGGNILALTCDYRYAAASDDKKIGLSELKLGVPVPYLADLMLRHTIGNRYAAQMIFSGAFISFSDAKAIGLVDAVGSPDELEDFTLERLSRLASHPSQAFAAAKANHVQEIRLRYERHGEAKNAAFLDCWFSEPAQTALRDMAVKF